MTPSTSSTIQERVLSLWLDGVSTAEIAREVGRHPSTVSRIARRQLGLPPRVVRGGNTLQQVRVRQIRRLWPTGMTTAEIGRRVGLSPQSVSRLAKSAGLPRRRPPQGSGRPHPDTVREQVRSLWPDRSMTAAEVGRRIGIPAGTVSRMAGEMGLPPRHRHRPTREAAQAAKARLPSLWEDRTRSLPEIAEELGVQPVSLSRWARELGLPHRHRGRKS